MHQALLLQTEGIREAITRISQAQDTIETNSRRAVLIPVTLRVGMEADRRAPAIRARIIKGKTGQARAQALAIRVQAVPANQADTRGQAIREPIIKARIQAIRASVLHQDTAVKLDLKVPEAILQAVTLPRVASRAVTKVRVPQAIKDPREAIPRAVIRRGK